MPFLAIWGRKGYFYTCWGSLSIRGMLIIITMQVVVMNLWSEVKRMAIRLRHSGMFFVRSCMPETFETSARETSGKGENEEKKI